MIEGRAHHRIDWIRGWSLGGSLIALGSFLAMALLFLAQSWPTWSRQGASFVSGERWFFRASEFGALPMIYGTLAVAAVALVLAVPLGLGAAIFTAELLPGRARLPVKAAIELLAGVPSVVYGLLGVLLLRNWIYRLAEPWEPLSGDTLLTAGVLLGVMVLPTVTTLGDDALRGVPAAQRAAARGLGLTRAETVLGVTLPQALPGLAAAVLLGLGRALGETIAVFLVVGRQDNQLPESWLSPRPLVEAGQTLTSKLGGSETFLAMGEGEHWAAMMALAFTLLLLAGSVTVVGVRLGERARRRLEGSDA